MACRCWVHPFNPRANGSRSTSPRQRLLIASAVSGPLPHRGSATTAGDLCRATTRCASFIVFDAATNGRDRHNLADKESPEETGDLGSARMMPIPLKCCQSRRASTWQYSKKTHAGRSRFPAGLSGEGPRSAGLPGRHRRATGDSSASAPDGADATGRRDQGVVAAGARRHAPSGFGSRLQMRQPSSTSPSGEGTQVLLGAFACLAMSTERRMVTPVCRGAAGAAAPPAPRHLLRQGAAPAPRRARLRPGVHRGSRSQLSAERHRQQGRDHAGVWTRPVGDDPRSAIRRTISSGRRGPGAVADATAEGSLPLLAQGPARRR